MTYINEQKILGSDNVTKADVVTNTDEDTDLTGKNGLVASSILYAIDDTGVVKPLKMDLVTHAIVTMNQEHYKMHDGNGFFIKTFIANAVGAATNYFAFTTPDTTTRIHAKALIAPDIDYTINIYEGSVITGGTTVANVNNDRDSVNAGNLVAIANPTHTTPGTIIWAARNGGGKNPVGVAPGANYEIIAARNTTYVFELIKNTVSSAGVVDIDFWWYEQVPKS